MERLGEEPTEGHTSWLWPLGDLISMLTWRMQEIRGRSRLPLETLTCLLHQEEAKIKGQGEPSLLVIPLGQGLWPGLPRSHPVE